MTNKKFTNKKKLNEADDLDVEPAYNKEGERQYNKNVFNAAEPTDADLDPDNIEVFDEETAPATQLTSMGTKTKSEQDLSIKALDMSLDVVKLLAGYKVETVFKVAALLQRYIASGESK